MEKYNKVSSKMYKHLVQQSVQQKVQQKIAQQLCCTFDKAVCVYQVSGISLSIA